MDITLEQFYESIAQFNQMIYPAQWAVMLLAFTAVLFIMVKKSFSNALIIGVAILFYLMCALAFWLPMGFRGYENGFLYMAIFILEAGFLLSAAVENELDFEFKPTPYAIIGLIFVAYGLIGYPLAGLALGHTYPELIFSPLLPCPLNTWWVGMLLMTTKPVPRYTLIIPFIWGLVGIMWVGLGVTDYIAGLIICLSAPALLVIRDRGKYHHLHYP
ncbi:MAG: DUF6064 family protein [Anaerolineae bacterium]|jgi:hypothetical protein|nr:DUF6064 family protein [Anaerolineae bacterium]